VVQNYIGGGATNSSYSESFGIFCYGSKINNGVLVSEDKSEVIPPRKATAYGK